MADLSFADVMAALDAQQRSAQADQQNRVASASPELLNLLAEYGLIEPQQMFAAKQMAEAEKMRDTPMPQGITVRDQYVAPSVFGVADAALRRGMGWHDAEKEKQAIMAGFLRKMQANRAIGQNEQDYARSQLAAQAAQEPRPPTPEDLAYIGSTPQLVEGSLTPGMGRPGQEGPDITEGRPVPRKPAPMGPPPPPVATPWDPPQPRPLMSPLAGYLFGSRFPGVR